jgi:type VI secretion system secreted protein VgrG
MRKIKVWLIFTLSILSVILMGLFFSNVFASPAFAISPSLGVLDQYSVLGGSTVTNTGLTTISGDLGVSPGSEITGFPPGVTSGIIHTADANTADAQIANAAAFSSLNQACDQTFGTADLSTIFSGGIGPGVYCSTSNFSLSGNLNLIGSGVWIFRTETTLGTASGSSITGGNPSNVWWQVGSSATLGTNTSFEGNILALVSITLNTGASLNGRALAQFGAVSLSGNTIFGPYYAESPTATDTLLATPIETETAFPVITETLTQTATETETQTYTETGTPPTPAQPTLTETLLPTQTDTVTVLPSFTETIQVTETASAAPTNAPTNTLSASETFQPTNTPLPTLVDTPENTALPTTVPASPTNSPTNTLSASETPLPSNTQVPTLVDTPENTATALLTTDPVTPTISEAPTATPANTTTQLPEITTTTEATPQQTAKPTKSPARPVHAVATATPTFLPAIYSLPDSGGAPIRDETLSWVLGIAISFSLFLLVIQS